MALVPYPTQIPAETWAIVVQAFTGHVADVPHAVHCGYECLGFALSKAAPDAASFAAHKVSIAKDPSHSFALSNARTLAEGKALSMTGGSWISMAEMILAMLKQLMG